MEKSLMVLQSFRDIDLYEQDEEAIINIKDEVVESIKISELEKMVNKAIIKLSSVTNPCFGANIKYITLDNQKRLELIYELLSNFEDVKIRTRNLKRNKQNCNEDYDGVFFYLLKVQDILNAIENYVDFRKEERIEAIKTVQQNELEYKELKMLEEKI